MRRFVRTVSLEKNDPVFGALMDVGGKNFTTKTGGKILRHATARPILQRDMKFSVQSRDENTKDGGKNVNCYYCNNNNKIDSFDDLKKLNGEEKFEFIRAKKLCDNCLSSCNFATGCKRKHECTIQGCKINRKHITSILNAIVGFEQRRKKLLEHRRMWMNSRTCKVYNYQEQLIVAIGVDVPEAVQQVAIRESRNGGPYAVNTLFGWTLNGPLNRCSKDKHCFLTRATASSDEPFQWRYINTKLNPADDAPRGLYVDNLIKGRRWIKGPEFLREAESMWPSSVAKLEPMPESYSEVKRAAKSYSTHVESTESMTKLIFSKFSNWKKLQKAVAWMLRYKAWIMERVWKKDGGSNKAKTGRITVEEMQKAEHCIISCVQKENFAEEINRLRSVRSVKKSRPLFRLDPVILDNLLCVGGRLKHAPDGYNIARHPSILPKNHHVCDLIIRYHHEMSSS